MFVDWVSVSQYHGGDLPEIVGSLNFKNLDEDAPIESAGPRQYRGSHDSSLQVKAHNGWVRVSGNPSRWNRPDNLFGYDLDECMAVINDHLSTLGLPPFTVGVPVSPDRNERRASVGLASIDGETVDGMGEGEPIAWSGAAFSRIDLCQNFAAGSEFLARLAMRSYQARAVARMKKAPMETKPRSGTTPVARSRHTAKAPTWPFIVPTAPGFSGPTITEFFDTKSPSSHVTYRPPACATGGTSTWAHCTEYSKEKLKSCGALMRRSTRWPSRLAQLALGWFTRRG